MDSMYCDKRISCSTFKYDIEMITGTMKHENNTRYYRVKWKESWEAEENLLYCSGLINEFWESRGGSIRFVDQGQNSNEKPAAKDGLPSKGVRFRRKRSRQRVPQTQPSRDVLCYNNLGDIICKESHCETMLAEQDDSGSALISDVTYVRPSKNPGVSKATQVGGSLSLCPCACEGVCSCHLIVKPKLGPGYLDSTTKSTPKIQNSAFRPEDCEALTSVKEPCRTSCVTPPIVTSNCDVSMLGSFDNAAAEALLDLAASSMRWSTVVAPMASVSDNTISISSDSISRNDVSNEQPHRSVVESPMSTAEPLISELHQASYRSPSDAPQCFVTPNAANKQAVVVEHSSQVPICLNDELLIGESKKRRKRLIPNSDGCCDGEVSCKKSAVGINFASAHHVDRSNQNLKYPNLVRKENMQMDGSSMTLIQSSDDLAVDLNDPAVSCRGKTNGAAELASAYSSSVAVDLPLPSDAPTVRNSVKCIECSSISSLCSRVPWNREACKACEGLSTFAHFVRVAKASAGKDVDYKRLPSLSNNSNCDVELELGSADSHGVDLKCALYKNDIMSGELKVAFADSDGVNLDSSLNNNDVITRGLKLASADADGVNLESALDNNNVICGWLTVTSFDSNSVNLQIGLDNSNVTSGSLKLASADGDGVNLGSALDNEDVISGGLKLASADTDCANLESALDNNDIISGCLKLASSNSDGVDLEIAIENNDTINGGRKLASADSDGLDNNDIVSGGLTVTSADSDRANLESALDNNDIISGCLKLASSNSDSVDSEIAIENNDTINGGRKLASADIEGLHNNDIVSGGLTVTPAYSIRVNLESALDNSDIMSGELKLAPVDSIYDKWLTLDNNDANGRKLSMASADSCKVDSERLRSESGGLKLTPADSYDIAIISGGLAVTSADSGSVNLESALADIHIISGGLTGTSADSNNQKFLAVDNNDRSGGRLRMPLADSSKVLSGRFRSETGELKLTSAYSYDMNAHFLLSPENKNSFSGELSVGSRDSSCVDDSRLPSGSTSNTNGDRMPAHLQQSPFGHVRRAVESLADVFFESLPSSEDDFANTAGLKLTLADSCDGDTERFPSIDDDYIITGEAIVVSADGGDLNSGKLFYVDKSETTSKVLKLSSAETYEVDSERCLSVDFNRKEALKKAPAKTCSVVSERLFCVDNGNADNGEIHVFSADNDDVSSGRLLSVDISDPNCETVAFYHEGSLLLENDVTSSSRLKVTSADCCDVDTERLFSVDIEPGKVGEPGKSSEDSCDGDRERIASADDSNVINKVMKVASADIKNTGPRCLRELTLESEDQARCCASSESTIRLADLWVYQPVVILHDIRREAKSTR